MEEKVFTVVDENGNETLCEIIFTFHSDEYNKDYVIYTMPGTEDEDGIEVSAAAYEETADGEGLLSAIETDAEWELVEEMLAAFDDENEE